MLKIFHINHLSKLPYVTSISDINHLAKTLMLQVFHINHLAKNLMLQVFRINHLSDKNRYVTSISH